MDTKKNHLVVTEAYSMDLGSGIARIDKDQMNDLGLSQGDIIEVKGRRSTVAKCHPQLPPEAEAELVQPTRALDKIHDIAPIDKASHATKFDMENKGIPKQQTSRFTSACIIRLDGLIRNNAGIAIGNTVEVRKIVAPVAEQVVVNPVEAIPPINERLLADTLRGYSLDKRRLCIGTILSWQIDIFSDGYKPNANAVVVTQETVFSITNHSPTLMAAGDFKYNAFGKNVNLILNDSLRKEVSGESYLVLKFQLHHGGSGTEGEFEVRLRDSAIQETFLLYKEWAEEIVLTANRKIAGSNTIKSPVLIGDLKFEILEKWRKL